MAEPLRNTRIMTRTEYLAFEEEAETKHEFHAFPDGGGDLGLVVAMAGSSLAHNQIVSNLAFELRRRLGERGCRVLTSDLRVQAGTRYYYPDVVALCDEPMIEPDVRPDTLANPLVLIEVASSSTSEVDRGKKLHRYTQIESLQEYWIVEQAEALVTRIVRSDAGVAAPVRPRRRGRAGKRGARSLDPVGRRLCLGGLSADRAGSLKW